MAKLTPMNNVLSDKQLNKINKSTISSIYIVILILSRILSALFIPISDCDETFNYFEPLHYMLYNTGLQTWEYNPNYGLRSYIYTGIHAIVGCILMGIYRITNINLQIISPFILLFVKNIKIPNFILDEMYKNLGYKFSTEKLFIFYGLRIVLGLFNVYATIKFINSVIKKYELSSISNYIVISFAFAPAFVNSSISFLPQTFVLDFLLLAHSFWLNNDYFYAIHLMGISIVVGCWPFAALIMLPMVLHISFSQSLFKSIFACIPTFIIFMIAMVVDTFYYGKVVIPLLNLFTYNTTAGGPELYGTEPSIYYLKNLFLNFNILFPLSILGILSIKSILLLSGGFIWMAFMFSMAHKEERFLIPIYHLIVLSSMLLIIKMPEIIRKFLLAVFVVISLSRSIALVKYYSAPMYLFASVPGQLCVGKEWYRFPSSFAVEQTPLFIKSHFKGQLPQPYSQSYIVQPNFNNMNMEENSRYTPIESCHYIVDLKLTENYPGYGVLTEEDFLDANNSPVLTRAFYIPYYSDLKNTYIKYQVLIKNN